MVIYIKIIIFLILKRKLKKIFVSSKFSISKKINNLERFIEKNHFKDNSKLYYGLIQKMKQFFHFFFVSYNLEEFTHLKQFDFFLQD